VGQGKRAGTGAVRGWRQARWWLVGLTEDGQQWWGGEAVQCGSVSTAARCSGSLRREQWGPGAQGIREEGEGHDHFIGRASGAALQ
jgi:hypothetical protein